MRRLRHSIGLLVLGCAIGLAAAGGGTFASFSKTTSNDSNSITGARIFPGVRTVSAWKLDDAANGTPANKDDTLSYVDAVLKTTGNFASAYSATRYVDFDFQGSRPASVPVTSASFTMTFAAGAAGDTGCYYFDLRRISDGSLINTYGSAASTEAGGAAGCVTGATQTAKTTSITIPAADVNNLSVRVYGYESGNRGLKIDRAAITGTSYGDSWTLYEQRYGDKAAGGAETYTLWSQYAQDAVSYTTANNWGSAYVATKYLKFTFPSDYVPSSAVVTSVSLTYTFASSATSSACVFYEVYSSGGTLLGTHGSSGSPSKCVTGTTMGTDTVSLTEVDTPAKANGAYVKAYSWESGGKKTVSDVAKLDVNYYLN